MRSYEPRGLALVPRELKDEPRWVCWRRVVRGGRATKMPVSARGGGAASSTDPATWATFREAVEAVAPLKCDGVGFVFGPDRAFTGLDLDHVLHDGALEEQYRWVVEEAGTYTEVSPSGEGLHLIFRGPKPDWAARSRKGPVEMYDHDRFFTVTGTVFEGHGALADDDGTIEKAYRMWIEEGPANGGQATLADAVAEDAGGGDLLTDDELMERAYASRSGAAIRALMSGDMGAQGGDHSAADMALCSHLAFWLGGDASRVDRVFRSSGLMRDKWDSRRGAQTYGEQTVRRAIEGCSEFYKPKPRRARANTRSVTDGMKKNGCSIARAGGGTEGSSSPAGEAEPFDFSHAPAFGEWGVDGQGRLWAVDDKGRYLSTLTRTAPWVACDLVDVDTGAVRALVRVKVRGHVREQAFDREVILNQNRIVAALAPLGANVASTSAREVVRYLNDCDRLLGDERPLSLSVTHLGWADAPLGAFMPYDAGGGEVRFDPAPDEAAKARPFMEPTGTLAGWVAAMAPVRAKSPAFRCVMAASFASPLVAVLGVQTFIVYLWGRSRSGKTPTLKAAGSVWGDPTEGTDSYFRTFADTPKAIVRAAALYHDVPVIIDELQSKGAPGGQAGKRQIVEDLLYSLSLGHERGALNSDRSMMRVGSWRSLTIATGEIPIVGDSTQQGAANRTLEINAEPFSDVREAQAMHRAVAGQHGTAGRAFVVALRGNGAEFYAGQLARVRDDVAAMACGHPQADNVALLALADALAEYYVFSPGREWGKCVESALGMAEWALAHSTGLEAGDTDLKAMQFVSEWLVSNSIHFDDGCEMDRLDRWGAKVDHTDRPGFAWYVFSSVLTKALEAHNFDRRKTLGRMGEEGLLLPGQQGSPWLRQRRFDGSRVWCVAIDNDALEAATTRAAGVTASQAL